MIFLLFFFGISLNVFVFTALSLKNKDSKRGGFAAMPLENNFFKQHLKNLLFCGMLKVLHETINSNKEPLFQERNLHWWS